MSQPGNWEIDLVVQRIGAYDLNYSFEAALGAGSEHENMDMGANMNMENNETGTSTTPNTSSLENELESPPSSPAFDSFAWLAIGLSVAVGVGSASYFRKSKKQLESTIKTLEGSMNQ